MFFNTVPKQGETPNAIGFPGGTVMWQSEVPFAARKFDE